MRGQIDDAVLCARTVLQLLNHLLVLHLEDNVTSAHDVVMTVQFLSDSDGPFLYLDAARPFL